MKTKNLLAKISFLFALVALFQNCEVTDDKKEAPVLPPESSMIADFSVFEKTPNKSMELDTISYLNFWAAHGTVTVWNLILTVNLAIPVAAFKESFKHQAVYDDSSKVWKWEFTLKTTEFVWAILKVDTVYYTANLHGKVVNDSAEWKMYLTKTNGNSPFNNFLWYYGKSAKNSTGGWWIINELPKNPQTFLRINWERESNTIGKIRYTNIRPKSTGGYLEYGTTLPDSYGMNAYYDVMDTVNHKTVQIKINLSTKQGRIKKINSDKWECWDSQLRDVTCP